ncbi:MAG: phosphopantothenate/pantothenate synthetase [Methanomicrobiales archaeon]|nr:phosphopantothenate/pantothenate synthetase [Methanomicrobiales archaeon]
MIPLDHPRYRSLQTREHLADCAREGIVSLEGLTAHGRGEAFDYLLGEKTTDSALCAERTAAALLRAARRPIFSVNGNTAALAAPLIAHLQEVSRLPVEVNLFHRTNERMQKITAHLESHGVQVLTGTAERLLPLSHDRAWCLRKGLYEADTVLVPLEDGNRATALRGMGKQVIAIDLNPLSRTAKAATLTIVDELTRALPHLIEAFSQLSLEECQDLVAHLDNRYFLYSALEEMKRRLDHGLD